MRNLKKLLALTLAMVMAFSLMLSANAVSYSDYGDKDQITEEFKEAVQVLTGLEVFQGDEKGFRPADTITRAEAAAIVYRVATQDVKDTQAKLYSDYGTFTDVNKDDWFAGYVGYCQNAGYIKGTSPTTFNPYGKVTGYEMLAMILRVVGYGKNNEFVGPEWQVNVASLSKELGVINKVKSANFEHTLTMAARRDVVASLVFETMVKVPTVTYTSALNYSDKASLLSQGKNPTLGQKNFGLYHDTEWKATGKWGAPGYSWYKGGTHLTTVKDGNTVYLYDSKWLPSYGSTGTSIATILPEATKTYDDATTRECDVAHDLDFDGDKNFKLYVNSDTAITTAYKVVATDTVTKVGGQGRETKFWYGVTSEYADKMDPWCTMVDTFLAKVTKVEKEVLDAKDHQMIPAKLTLTVYDGYSDSEAGTNTKSLPAGHTRVATKASGNWEFVKGDFVTLNAWTDNANGIDANDKGTSHDYDDAEANLAAFEAEQTAIKSGTTNEFAYATNVKKCEPVLGKQSVVYWNQGKHNVDGTDKLDQLDLHLDVAGSTVNTTFAWYYDAKGNLIGIGDAPNNINYGIITSLYSAFKQGDASTTGEAVARAHVKYADGTEGDVIIDKFYVNSGTMAAVGTSGHTTAGSEMKDYPAGTTVTGGADSTELLPIYDNGSQAAMSASKRADVTTMAHGKQAGWLHVAPVAAVNASSEAAASTAADPWGSIAGATGSYGIIKGNLFKFVNSADGYMTAIEVAGSGNTTTYSAPNLYNYHYNDETTAKSELSKNYSYLTVDTTTIRMDNDTKIIVRGCKMETDDDFKSATDTITVYDGIDELPASIIVPDESEVDWADIDNNGIADVVYVYGVKKGATGYGLFYYNGSAGQWTGSATDGSGWLRGWLDAKEADLTFTNKDLFDRVQQSTITYGAHLFGVKLLDGEVEELLGYNSLAGSKNKDFFLISTDATTPYVPGAAAIALSNLAAGTWDSVADGLSAAGGAAFQFGTDNGNDYTTAQTKAVWLHDAGVNQNTNGTYTDVRYNPDNNTIETATYTVAAGVKGSLSAYSIAYRLTGSSAQLGDALYFLNMTGRVNDVTIVFEDNADDAIRQIYVTTRPDITPPDGTGSATSNAATKATVDGINVIGGTDVQMGNLVTGGTPNIVLYGTQGVKNNAGAIDWAVATAGSDMTAAESKDVIWFPYSHVLPTGGNANAVLTIWNSKGEIVFSENNKLTTSTRTWRCFAVKFTAAEGGITGANYGKFPLAKGKYIYKITVDNVLASQGYFTLS